MCVWVIYEQLNQENGKGHEPVFFWYIFGTILTKPSSLSFLNRPVVSGLIDDFVTQLWMWYLSVYN